MTNKRATLTLILAALLVMFLACPVWAKVSGPCANCHTMHNSQQGSMVNENDPGPSSQKLLNTDCVGCHTATDGTTWKNSIDAPIVYNTSEPQYGADAGDGKKQGLAGGNFYWVDQDDTFGHNIFSPDPNHSEAPGKLGGCGSGNSCHLNLDRSTTGFGTAINDKEACLSCHMLPGQHSSIRITRYHHADDSVPFIQSYTQGWYRFLSGHPSRNMGVKAIEDSDWQYTVSPTDHNEYYGEVRAKTRSGFAGGFSRTGNTMTAFCTGCHNEFMKQDDTAEGASPWLRHPSDQPIPATGEYASYTEYDPLVPVARPELTEVSSVVTPGTDMVMCLSCHRAHGSPYPDMLRFDPDEMVAGGGDGDGKGCFKCHSEKDGS